MIIDSLSILLNVIILTIIFIMFEQIIQENKKGKYPPLILLLGLFIIIWTNTHKIIVQFITTLHNS
jgi:hypothetical protein